MNKIQLDSAQSMYDSGDYRRALETFTALVQDTQDVFSPGEIGYVHHMIGNCLIKLKSFDKAIAAYQQALLDIDYRKRGSLNVNLGMAFSAVKDYEAAIDCFASALEDDSYETPYKALSAMGNAQLKMGKASDAGTSYRRAALEDNNPDPARCLVNLGVCFMALNRPSDAVEAYITALEFETTASAKNKTYANLGQAYVATGRMKEAVDAFNTALADGTYTLSNSAFVDYDRAKTSVEADSALDAGLDNFDDPYAFPAVRSPYYGTYHDSMDERSTIPPADDTGFFTLTEEEINRRGRNDMRHERKVRNIGPKIFLAFAIVLLLAVIGAGILYFKGYGYPLQETVITDMFTAYADEQSVTDYWASAEASDIDTAMACVAKSSNVTVDAVSRSLTESTVTATATLDEGGQARYKISMGRDGLGWKITNIELVFASEEN